GELLALSGWPGLVHQLATDPALAPHESVPASLMDFLAVRLLLTTAATASVAGSPADWRYDTKSTADPEAVRIARAATIFDALQLAGLSCRTLAALEPDQLQNLFRAINGFDDWE